MAFTYTDRNKKVVTQAVGKTKVTLIDAVAIGDLLAMGATSATNAARLADQSDGYVATLVALEDGVSGATIEAAFAAEIEAQPTIGDGGAVTQVNFAVTSDFLGSPLYLGESGKPSSSSGATTVQEVGKLLAVNRIMLIPGGSVYGSAANFTTGTFSGAVTFADTVDAASSVEAATLSITGTAVVSGAATLKSTLTVGSTAIISGNTTIQANLTVTGTATISNAATFSSTVAVSGTASLAGAVNVSGALTYYETCLHVSEASVTVSANKTLAVSDSGYVVKVNLTGVACTLPAVTGITPGLTYTIMNACTADALGDIRLNLGATQDKIFGTGISGTADLDLINSQATAAVGDLVTVIGNATTGWFIQRKYGTWNTT